MKLGLKDKLSLTVCVISAASSVALALLLVLVARYDLMEMSRQNIQVLEGNSRDQLETTLGNTAAQVAYQVANPLYFEDFSEITDRLALAAQDSLLDEVILLDAQGNLLNDGSNFFSRLGESANIPAVAMRQLQSGEPAFEQNGTRARAMHPVELGQEVLGILLVSAETATLLEAYNIARSNIATSAAEHVRFYISLAAGALLVLLAIVWWVSRIIASRLYEPLQELRSQAVKLGQGSGDDIEHIKRRDELGELADAVYTMARDLDMQNQSVKFLAFHDPLTGLLNRTGFQSRMEDDLEYLADNQMRGALLFIDIDDFKEVNDSMGHEAGDRALRAISDRLRKNLGAMDADWEIQHIARIGGDEFTLFVAPVSAEADIVLVVEEILSALTAPIIAEKDRIHISASVGLANYPEDGDSVSVLLNNADAAMYTSKHLGKGTYRFYEPEMNSALFRSSVIKTEFQKALRSDDQLELMFQPIVNLETNEIVSAEALIRWHHPRLGYLSPEQFIAIVEHNEVALSTDLWVLNKTLSLLEQLNKSGAPAVSISINISASNLMRKQFTSAIAKIIKHREVLAQRIKLEITETFLHSDDNQAHRSMQHLGEMGFEIWLDDFGTGYSSLRHLKEFPVDGFKIDKSFIESLADSPLNLKMVNALTGLAEAFSVAIVAEGIDRQDSLDLLRELGIKLGQGMLLGTPVSAPVLVTNLTGSERKGNVHQLKTD